MDASEEVFLRNHRAAVLSRRDDEQQFYGAKASGIVCITFPCPSIHERKLNFRTEQLIAEVDLAASGAGTEQVEAGYNALSEPAGILAVGEHHVIAGPAGRGLKLVTSEFYLPLVAKNLPVGQVCGGFQGLPCREGQFCDIDHVCRLSAIDAKHAI